MGRLNEGQGPQEQYAQELAVCVERAYAGDFNPTNGDYPYIAYSPKGFVDLLTRAYGVWKAQHPLNHAVPKVPKFLDVGCGIGTKVYLAQRVLDNTATSFGLEKHPAYCVKARQLLRAARWFYKGASPNKLVIRADALAYSDYGTFDLIYFFCPIADMQREEQLERRIVEQARPGTVILSPMYKALDRLPTLRSVRTKDHADIFVKE